MKKTCLTLIAFIFVRSLYAQWTTGTNIYNTNTGNVGIGINPANAKFQALISGTSEGAYFQNSSMDRIQFIQPERGVGYGLFGMPGGTPGIAAIGYGIDLSLGVGTYGNADLILGTFNTERARITSSGNIGIGTSSPDAKLAVKGTVHAQEVKVDMNVPGPDYVFEKNYNMRPLAEVEKYVAANRHLPEIPSAKSMEQNGINVGELNMKMLQKIEELTLYLIEKDKQLKLQGKRMFKMEQQIKALVKVKK